MEPSGDKMTKQRKGPITSYKGFDKELRCNPGGTPFQYEIGKTYEHTGSVVRCAVGGFHACEYPLDVLRYYAPAISRFAEVVQDGEIASDDEDTKIASAKITITAEIHLHELIQRAVSWVFERAKKTGRKHTKKKAGSANHLGTRGAASATGTSGAASATGTRGAASATGTSGAASATGESGAASATGTRGAASATGESGAASATGTRGAASATGWSGAAMASGFGGRVMGAKGCALFLVHRDDNWNITHTWSGIVGKDGIKVAVWYSLDKNGKPEEVE